MTPQLRATPLSDGRPRIAYRAGYKYQLAETYEIDTQILGYCVSTEWLSLDGAGHLVIRAGYAWDGASGPAADTASIMRGSLVHDALYQLIRLGLIDHRYKRLADDILRACCLRDGMNRVFAWATWTAVDKCADGATRPEAERPIIYAP